MPRKKTTQSNEPQAAPAAPPETHGMKVIAMQVENLKTVRFARIKPNGAMVTITGNNGSGKSTILDAIEWAVRGTSNISTVPVRKGQHAAKVQLILGNGEKAELLIERTFTKTDKMQDPYLTKLRVMSADKATFPTPQSLLDKLVGAISFDPLEFTRMDAKGQLATLRKLVQFDVDVDAIEAERKRLYDERREAGREEERHKARLASLPKPQEGLPDLPVSLLELSMELQRANDVNRYIDQQRATQAHKIELAQRYAQAAINISVQIEELERQIAELKEQRADANGAAVLMRAEAEAMDIGTPVDTSEITLKMQEAEKTNEAIRQRDAYQNAEADVETAQGKWTELDTAVKQKEQEKMAALERAKMPIEGLSIADLGNGDEVIYNGLPFSQASNAEQIRVSVAMAIASNPKLRVLRIKDGSLLDKKSLETIAAMATGSDYQVWVERVEGNGPVSVVMEDGTATGPETEAEPEKVAKP